MWFRILGMTALLSAVWGFAGDLGSLRLGVPLAILQTPSVSSDDGGFLERLAEAEALIPEEPHAALSLLAELSPRLAEKAKGVSLRYYLTAADAELLIGRVEAARKALTRAEALAAELGKTPASSRILVLKAGLAEARGETTVAEGYLEQALTLAAEHANPVAEVALVNRAAVLYLAMARPRLALQQLKYARRISTFPDQERLKAVTFHNLARAYEAQDEGTLAMDAYQKSLALTKSMGLIGRWPLLCDLGRFYLSRHEPTRAESVFREALTLADGKHPRQVCDVQIGHAEALFKMDQAAEALPILTEAVAQARDLGFSDLERRGWALKAKVLAALDRHKEALSAQQRYTALKDLDDILARQTRERAFEERLTAERNRQSRGLAQMNARLDELERQRTVSRYISLFVGIALIVALILLRHYRNSQQNLLKQERVTVEKLRQVDRLKDEFLANTSHELRTPLNGIIGLTESLLAGAAGELNHGLAHNLSMISYSGRRLSNLINDILDFSQLRNKDLTLLRKGVDVKVIADLVLTLSRPLAKNKDLRLVNLMTEQTFFVDADENRLQQIFYNLIGNAIKFTEHGVVKISAEHEDDMVVIRVDDTGMGIPSKDYERVFHSFEQLDGATNRGHSGAGLGLAVTRRLVHLHGGSIRVVPKQGPGACLAFSLPVWHGEVASESMDAKTVITQIKLPSVSEPILPAVAEAEQDDQRFRIMIVDDDPINRQVLVNHLSLEDYQLSEMSDGASVLEAFADGKPCDLIMLDIMMPKVSGYEVCRTLRETYSVSELPIIFITARNQLPNLETGFLVGGNDYVIKPVSKNELILRVRTHIHLLRGTRHLEQEVTARTHELDEKNRALKEANQRLERISTTDPLTGMGNRRFLRQFLEKELSRLARARKKGDTGPRFLSLSFLLIDLDHFKQVNDRHGHEAGDRVLAQMKPLMAKAAREEDLLIRWGGEEFLIVARESTGAGAAALAERLCTMVAEHPFDIGDKSLRLTCSIGFADYPFLNRAAQALTWEQIVRFADVGLYAAKKSGRNGWVGLAAGPALQPEMLTDLAGALEKEPEQLCRAQKIKVQTSFESPETLTWL